MGPPVEILYEEGPCLIVCKPGGLLTQAPPGVDSMEARLKAYLKDRDHKPGKVYLGVPHRLDRPVSGAMVFARHSRAARRLAEQFEARTVRKVYWACVEGRVEPDAGQWTDFIRKRPDQAQAQIVPAGSDGAREALLRYRIVERLVLADREGTWLKIELETGRMHQIRVQAAARGHPIVGDAQYGSNMPFGPAYDDVRLRSIALHARRLALAHPMTFAPLDVVAPTPAAWKALDLEGLAGADDPVQPTAN